MASPRAKLFIKEDLDFPFFYGGGACSPYPKIIMRYPLYILILEMKKNCILSLFDLLNSKNKHFQWSFLSYFSFQVALLNCSRLVQKYYCEVSPMYMQGLFFDHQIGKNNIPRAKMLSKFSFQVGCVARHLSKETIVRHPPCILLLKLKKKHFLSLFDQQNGKNKLLQLSFLNYFTFQVIVLARAMLWEILHVHFSWKWRENSCWDLLTLIMQKYAFPGVIFPFQNKKKIMGHPTCRHVLKMGTNWIFKHLLSGVIWKEENSPSTI